MNCYFVIHEFRNSRKYDSFFSEIMKYESYTKIFNNTWAISTSSTAREVYQHLSEHIQIDSLNNDGLMVIKTQREASWDNLINASSTDEWLIDNL